MSHSCARCDATWTGMGVAHCTADGCHRTFSGVGLFDRHRRDFACVDPATIAGLEFRDGQWRGPEASEEKRAELRARFPGKGDGQESTEPACPVPSPQPCLADAPGAVQPAEGSQP